MTDDPQSEPFAVLTYQPKGQWKTSRSVTRLIIVAGAFSAFAIALNRAGTLMLYGPQIKDFLNGDATFFNAAYLVSFVVQAPLALALTIACIQLLTSNRGSLLTLWGEVLLILLNVVVTGMVVFRYVMWPDNEPPNYGVSVMVQYVSSLLSEGAVPLLVIAVLMRRE